MIVAGLSGVLQYLGVGWSNQMEVNAVLHLAPQSSCARPALQNYAHCYGETPACSGFLWSVDSTAA